MATKTLTRNSCPTEVCDMMDFHGWQCKATPCQHPGCKKTVCKLNKSMCGMVDCPSHIRPARFIYACDEHTQEIRAPMGETLICVNNTKCPAAIRERECAF